MFKYTKKKLIKAAKHIIQKIYNPTTISYEEESHKIAWKNPSETNESY